MMYDRRQLSLCFDLASEPLGHVPGGLTFSGDSELDAWRRYALLHNSTIASCGYRVRQDAPDPDQNPSTLEIVLAVELIDAFGDMSPQQQAALVAILFEELGQQTTPLTDGQIASAVARVDAANAVCNVTEKPQ